jgi:hypothetical protein
MMHSLQKWNDQKMQALVNMQFSIDAGEERVQLATEETFNKMQEALNLSEANNRTLQERIAQLARENEALKLQNKELVKTTSNEKQAQESAFQEVMMRMKGLVEGAVAECGHIIKFAQDRIPKIKPDYLNSIWDCETASELTAAHERAVSEMNDLHESGKNLMVQLDKLKRM